MTSHVLDLSLQNGQAADAAIAEAEARFEATLPKRPKCNICGKRRRRGAWGEYNRTAFKAGGSAFYLICVHCTHKRPYWRQVSKIYDPEIRDGN